MENTRKIVGKCGLCGTAVYDHNEEVTGSTKLCEECHMEAMDFGLSDEDIEDSF
jgi:formylmethanofuran dehydrogenase subunit E